MPFPNLEDLCPNCKRPYSEHRVYGFSSGAIGYECPTSKVDEDIRLSKMLEKRLTR